jgi:HAD superfamily hydrolase (TIGR01509 family)
MVVKAIVFDFDGVLVDSEPVRFRAGTQAFAEAGLTLTWDRFITFWLGRTDEAGLRDLLGQRFEHEGARIAARRNALYGEWLDEVPVCPDAAGLLRRVPPGVRLAVATGSRRIEVDRILRRLGLVETFPVVVTAEDYEHAKPAPDPFLAAARRLNLPPSSCLAIEDTPAGVAAALAAGMPVVVVDRGRGALRLDHATRTVVTLDHLRLTSTGEVCLKP